MSTDTVVCRYESADSAEARGRELHREFVGMLFALAIAQVAVKGSEIVNSSVPTAQTIPSWTHLTLASSLIACSWVGWGLSDFSLSKVRNVFTKDFWELAVDLWLVMAYFFVVNGVELPTGPVPMITPSAPSSRQRS